MTMLSYAFSFERSSAEKAGYAMGGLRAFCKMGTCHERQRM